MINKAIKFFEEEIVRLRKAPEINGCEMTPEWKEMLQIYNTAVQALGKQIPKKPKHIHKEYEKHEWKKDEDGNIDLWAMEYEHHNGPRCERCGESYCAHCNPDYDDEPCITDKNYCPTCGKSVYSFEKKSFCVHCGQPLDWSDVV